MPVKSKPRHRRKPRNAPRRRGKTNRSYAARSTFRGTTVIPDRANLKLKYYDSVVTASGVLPAHHIFQTSLFDPDQTGIGHQPLGRDQWATFYAKYRVHGIGYRIIAYNSNALTQADVSVTQKPTTAVSADYRLLWETPYTQTRVVSPEGSGRAQTVFTGYLSIPKVCGVNKTRVRNDDVFSALMGANPGTMAYLHLSSIASDQVTAVSVRWSVNLTYYVSLYDRVPLTTS